MADVAAHGDLPVLIIGAGSCGLAIAQGLRSNNIPAIVFERDPSIDPDGRRRWAFAMTEWAVPTLRHLVGEDLWARIGTALADPDMGVRDKDSLPLLQGATGEQLGGLPFGGHYRLNRARTRALLAEGIDVRFGKRLQGVEFDEAAGVVTAVFDDGSRESGRLLIGADGAKSAVRTALLGAEAAAVKRLPFSSTFVQGKYTREQALHLRSFHPIITMMYHPENMLGAVLAMDTPSNGNPEDWTFLAFVNWRSMVEEQDRDKATMSVRDRLAQVKAHAARFADPIRSAFAWLPDDWHEVHPVPVTNWDPSLPEHRWDTKRGLATLVGDAAHPMTFHRGQGLNIAIGDAGKLVDLLAKPDGRSQEELIRLFEEEMRERAGKEVRLSEANTFMLHDFERLSESPLFKRGTQHHS